MIIVHTTFEAVIYLLLGIFIIIGTVKRWSWMVDPPFSKYWMFFPSLYLNKFLGRPFIIYFNYIIGIVSIICGLIGIWKGI